MINNHSVNSCRRTRRQPILVCTHWMPSTKPLTDISSARAIAIRLTRPIFRSPRSTPPMYMFDEDLRDVPAPLATFPVLRVAYVSESRIELGQDVPRPTEFIICGLCVYRL